MQSGMAIFIKGALLCITLQGQAQASNVGNLITVFNYKLKLSIARAYLPHPELSAFCLIPPCGHLEVESILSDGYQQAL